MSLLNCSVQEKTANDQRKNHRRRDVTMSDTTQVEGWTKQPPLDGRANPCLNCPPIGAALPLDAIIAVGFGDAHASRDGVAVYSEPMPYETLKDCAICNGTGEVGSVKTVICGTCGGLGSVEDETATQREYWDVAEVEKLAALDPDHDWRIVLFGPLHGEVYQRHGVGEWNLIEKNKGFA
jgi:hypothetical protein